MTQVAEIIDNQGKLHSGRFPSESEARRWAEESRVRCLSGGKPLPVPARIRHTLRDLLDAAWETRWRGTPAGDSSYAAAFSVCEWFGIDSQADSVSPERVMELVRALRAKNSPATVNRKLSALSVLLSLGRDMGWIERDIKLPRQKEPPGRERWVTQEEEVTFIQAMKQIGQPRMAVLVQWLCHTGIRLGASLGVEWRDIVDGCVVVRGVLSKSGKPYRVPLTVDLQESLRSLGGDNQPGPFHGITHRQVYYQWERMLDHLRIDDHELTPHSCRHGFVTRLIARGVPLALVSQLAGHRSTTTTLRYSHIVPVQTDGILQSVFGGGR